MHRSKLSSSMYGIMTEELFIREIRIDEATGRGDSDSQMTSFDVIMPLKLQSTKILIYSISDIKSVLHYTISMHNTNCPIVRSVVLYQLVICENECMLRQSKNGGLEFN